MAYSSNILLADWPVPSNRLILIISLLHIDERPQKGTMA